MLGIQTTTFCGHLMVRCGDLWVSRAPLEQGTAEAFVRKLNRDGASYGILDERLIAGKNAGILTLHASLDDLRVLMGEDKMRDFHNNRELAMNDDKTVMAFKFPTFPSGEEIGVRFLRHPIFGVSYPQARGLALAMGLDLPTDRQFLEILKGSTTDSFFTSPEDPDFAQYVHCSIGTEHRGTLDVEDERYRDQPHGTRHWLGNVEKWMLRDFSEEDQFASRGGSWVEHDPKFFSPSFRYSQNIEIYDLVGMVCVGAVQGSK
ncbi:MAG TPA: SUMF1/EgtB/PvdO family nonheme iron enzyme [bacterium]|nr:SUMF1/EgtB/PvdO family nonheme iron enzyme [bacterium]